MFIGGNRAVWEKCEAPCEEEGEGPRAKTSGINGQKYAILTLRVAIFGSDWVFLNVYFM